MSVLAIVAAVAGFYGAVVLTVWLGGLDAAEAVPPAGLAGAGLLTGIVAPFAWTRSGTATAAIVLAGAVIGFRRGDPRSGPRLGRGRRSAGGRGHPRHRTCDTHHREHEMSGRPGHVLIVGGGVAGFAVAAGLHDRGVPVEIAERLPSWDVAGYGLSLRPAGMAALDRLGVADAVRAAGDPVDRLTMCDPDGHALAPVNLHAGARHPFTAIRPRRADHHPAPPRR